MPLHVFTMLWAPAAELKTFYSVDRDVAGNSGGCRGTLAMVLLPAVDVAVLQPSDTKGQGFTPGAKQ